MCRRRDTKVPQRLHLTPALRIYLDQTYEVRDDLNADDTVQYSPFCCVCWRNDVQEENAERDTSKHGGDDHEQLNTSYDQFEHRLLLSFCQRVKVSSQATLPRKSEKYRMRQSTQLEMSAISFTLMKTNTYH